MSIPLYCDTCGDFVGTASTLEAIQANREGIVYIPCSGKGTHQKPKRTETLHLFGLVKRVCVSYPETGTGSRWQEYNGPASRPLAFIAIIWSGGRMLVDGKWCFWDWKPGFYGDGAKALGLLT